MARPGRAGRPRSAPRPAPACRACTRASPAAGGDRRSGLPPSCPVSCNRLPSSKWASARSGLSLIAVRKAANGLGTAASRPFRIFPRLSAALGWRGWIASERESRAAASSWRCWRSRTRPIACSTSGCDAIAEPGACGGPAPVRRPWHRPGAATGWPAAAGGQPAGRASSPWNRPAYHCKMTQRQVINHLPHLNFLDQRQHCVFGFHRLSPEGPYSLDIDDLISICGWGRPEWTC